MRFEFSVRNVIPNKGSVTYPVLLCSYVRMSRECRLFLPSLYHTHPLVTPLISHRTSPYLTHSSSYHCSRASQLREVLLYLCWWLIHNHEGPRSRSRQVSSLGTGGPPRHPSHRMRRVCVRGIQMQTQGEEECPGGSFCRRPRIRDVCLKNWHCLLLSSRREASNCRLNLSISSRQCPC